MIDHDPVLAQHGFRCVGVHAIQHEEAAPDASVVLVQKPFWNAETQKLVLQDDLADGVRIDDVVVRKLVL